MKKIVATLGAGLMSVGLIAGTAGFANAMSGSIHTTGPDSTNRVVSTDSSHVRVHNNNHASLHNGNSQSASSGTANSSHSTTAGDAHTGSASNANAVNASMTLDNSASGAGMQAPTSSTNGTGSVSDTGPDSSNVVKSKTVSRVNVTNNNDLWVSNYNDQDAVSGNANVSDNTSGGSATTGNASNTSSTTVTYKVTN